MFIKKINGNGACIYGQSDVLWYKYWIYYLHEEYKLYNSLLKAQLKQFILWI